VGNRQLEGLELMNLGMAYERLGQRSRADSNYKESRDLYEQIGDERRAAEQDVNLANLLIEYQGNHEELLRRVENALATFRKLGQVNFEVVAMAVKASAYRSAGRHEEARKLLAEALTKAKERQLGDRVSSITVDLAQSHLQLSEYEAARAQLEPLTSGGGRSDPAVHLRLGQAYLRLGVFDIAYGHLDNALGDIKNREILEYVPLAHTALGELAYESGKVEEARQQFETASALWTDELPDPASVEARCNLGSLTPKSGRFDSVRVLVETSVGQALRMGRVDLETRCRLQLARLYLGAGRAADATAALSKALDDAGKVGSELRAQVHYWRSRAMDATGDREGAQTEAAIARQLIKQLQESVPPQFRHRFVSRVGILPLVK
jgi:tetratricopeptide (TPR) repeat protein